jgi:hypothetical protein
MALLSVDVNIAHVTQQDRAGNSRNGPLDPSSILIVTISHRGGHDLLVFMPYLEGRVQFRLILKTHLNGHNNIRSSVSSANLIWSDL